MVALPAARLGLLVLCQRAKPALLDEHGRLLLQSLRRPRRPLLPAETGERRNESNVQHYRWGRDRVCVGGGGQTYQWSSYMVLD